MTDRETLMAYRLREAEETLDDALKMLDAKTSPRSVVNRAYYAMFYAVLGLFNRFGTEHRTSRHSTVIAIFDREFVRSGSIDFAIPGCSIDFSMHDRLPITKT